MNIFDTRTIEVDGTTVSLHPGQPITVVEEDGAVWSGVVLNFNENGENGGKWYGQVVKADGTVLNMTWRWVEYDNAKIYI